MPYPKIEPLSRACITNTHYTQNSKHYERNDECSRACNNSRWLCFWHHPSLPPPAHPCGLGAAAHHHRSHHQRGGEPDPDPRRQGHQPGAAQRVQSLLQPLRQGQWDHIHIHIWPYARGFTVVFNLQKRNGMMDPDDFRACLISMGYDLVSDEKTPPTHIKHLLYPYY